MEVFYNIRAIRDIRKKPSTSELIDWVNALQIGGIPADTIRKALPFVGVVVKKENAAAQERVRQFLLRVGGDDYYRAVLRLHRALGLIDIPLWGWW